MDKLYNRTYLKERRNSLRNNMTSAEAMLWSIIKSKQLGVKFRRQHSIGNYIVDFYSSEIKLVIEMDGGVHQDIIHQSNDEVRDNYLKDLGIKIIRFNNDEIYEDEERVKEELIGKIKELKFI
jgi:very-short-patch-repair endonuclease